MTRSPSVLALVLALLCLLAPAAVLAGCRPAAPPPEADGDTGAAGDTGTGSDATPPETTPPGGPDEGPAVELVASYANADYGFSFGYPEG